MPIARRCLAYTQGAATMAFRPCWPISRRDNPSLATGVSVLADRWTSEIAVRRKILSDMLEARTAIRKQMDVDKAGIQAEAAGINWHCRDSP